MSKVSHIYFAVKGNFFAENLPKDEHYQLVATVSTQNLDEIFSLAQNERESWTKNKQVTNTCANELRSFSVGDVVEINDKHFRCESIGWKEIDFKTGIPL